MLGWSVFSIDLRSPKGATFISFPGPFAMAAGSEDTLLVSPSLFLAFPRTRMDCSLPSLAHMLGVDTFGHQ